jgi:3-dehydroquinate synthase
VQEVKVSVKGPDLNYSVLIGNGLLGRLSELMEVGRYTKTMLVAGEHVDQHYGDVLRGALSEAEVMVLPAGEEGKNIDTVQTLWAAMRDADLDRRSLVVLAGGGVLGDMGAFAAATYMRGVAFAHVPTTLVAQADSSIGGKTGVDFGGLKNFVGAFAQPKVVIADTAVLATLPPRELNAGFGELLKHGLTRDAEYFHELSLKAPGEYSADEMAIFIEKSVSLKVAVVQRDTTEAGERKLLNFGHTVGHAVEALSWDTDHPLLHGEAVAIGMVAEAELSQRKGYLDEAEVERVRQAIIGAGLPARIPYQPLPKLLEKMHLDKKDAGGKIEFVLLEGIGRALYDQTIDETDVAEVLEQNMEPGK